MRLALNRAQRRRSDWVADSISGNAISRQADGVEVIVLVDNVVDISSSCARPEITRVWWAKENDRRSTVEVMPWAEHGFSALIRVRIGAEQRTLLFDAGTTGTVALHNAACVPFDWDEIDVMALSHSHFDHTGGLPKILPRVGRKPMSIVVHNDMFVKRGALNDEGRVVEYTEVVTRQELTDAGATLIANREPYGLFGGAVIVLGQIPRQTDFELAHHPRQMRHDGKQWSPDPWDWDDRSLVIPVRDEGVVIISGCAHAGIINSILHARSVSGCQQVRAVIGGFHLAGKKFEPLIEPTVREMQVFQPTLVVPLHCSGPRAVQAFAAAMPEATSSGGALMRIRIGRWDG
jgi:7,8-dihydropterin-6-yl-methyl-4-(beta-D-ribofuranosyl)aminobenzene 5'-phosphate synthase